MSKKENSISVTIFEVLLPFLDFIIISLVFTFALWLRFSSGFHNTDQPFKFHYIRLITFCIMALFWLGIFQVQGLYRSRIIMTKVRQSLYLLKGVSYGILIYIFLSYILKSSYLEESRLVIGYSWVLSFVLLCIVRILIYRQFYLKVIKGGVVRRVIIAGAGERGKKLVKKIMSYDTYGMEIIGFVDDKEELIGTSIEGIPILGKIDDINLIVHDHGVEEIYISINHINHQRLLEIVARCRETKVPIQVMSELYEVVTSKVDVEEFSGIPMVEIKDRYVDDLSFALKRLVDIVASLVLIIFFMPFFIMVSIIIKLTSTGPLLFKQVRIGKNGKRFAFYKFRSMVIDNDDRVHRDFLKNFINGSNSDSGRKSNKFKLTDDSRVTAIGKLLRRLSFDELPQLFNVLKGDMSLVGPRPCIPYEFDNYKPWHKRRFNVLPGITGLWQVSGRSSVAFNDMVILDLYYIENMSFWFDMQILFKTIPTVVNGAGAV